jgi:hypothetical protein
MTSVLVPIPNRMTPLQVVQVCSVYMNAHSMHDEHSGKYCLENYPFLKPGHDDQDMWVLDSTNDYFARHDKGWSEVQLSCRYDVQANFLKAIASLFTLRYGDTKKRLQPADAQ